MAHPWHDVHLPEDTETWFPLFIEIPMGSTVKYECGDAPQAEKAGGASVARAGEVDPRLAGAGLADAEVAARAAQRRAQLDQRPAAHWAARLGGLFGPFLDLLCPDPLRRQWHRLIPPPGRRYPDRPCTGV